MTRRWALAAALFLTATFGFLVVALGSQAGVFAWGRGADATGNTVVDTVASPTPKPRIVTEYVVVDATATADAAAPAQPSDGSAPADGAAYEDGEHDVQYSDEHEGEHHDDDHHEGDYEEHDD